MSEWEREMRELLQYLSVEQLQGAAELLRLMVGMNDSAEEAVNTKGVQQCANGL